MRTKHLLASSFAVLCISWGPLILSLEDDLGNHQAPMIDRRSYASVTDDADSAAAATVGHSNANGVIHWQHNTDWHDLIAFGPATVKAAFKKYSTAPDVLSLQECGWECLCGGTKTQNHHHLDGQGRCRRTSDHVVHFTADSVMGTIASFTNRKYRAAEILSQVAFVYRHPRFIKEGELKFGVTKTGSGVSGYHVIARCEGMLADATWGHRSMAILLRDTRNPTRDTDDRHILLGGANTSPSTCLAKQLRSLENSWRTAPSLGGNAGDLVDAFFMSGDFNVKPDGTTGSGGKSDSLDWYKNYWVHGDNGTTDDDIGDGKVDLPRRFDHAGNTYRNTLTSAPTMRIDYAFGRLYNQGRSGHWRRATTDPGTVDGALTGGHRAIRSSLSWVTN